MGQITLNYKSTFRLGKESPILYRNKAPVLALTVNNNNKNKTLCTYLSMLLFSQTFFSSAGSEEERKLSSSLFSNKIVGKSVQRDLNSNYLVLTLTLYLNAFNSKVQEEIIILKIPKFYSNFQNLSENKSDIYVVICLI